LTLVSGNGWLEPELRRIAALIDGELSFGNRALAVELLRQAGQLAHKMGSPVFERRCLLSLRDIGGLAQNPETHSRLRDTAHLDDLKSLVDCIVGSADALS
jgi:hypothetical protein